MIDQRILGLLGAASTWTGSTVATESVTGAAIGPSSTLYERGILIENLDSALNIYLAPTIAKLADATTRYTLRPGQARVIPCSDPGAIFARSASGTPSLSWIGA